MIERFLRHPLPWLVVLIGLALARVEGSGWLTPQVTNDTQSYEHLLAASSPAEAFSGLRTYGYPLIIRAFDLERGGWEAVPRFHFLVYAGAILLFWLAVYRFSRSRWMAFAAAVPFCFSPALEHVRLVVTDSIAESLGLAAVSLLLLLVSGGGRVWKCVLLALTVLLVCWIRPIYQFLVVLVPLLGGVLRLCHEPRRRLRLGQWTAGLAALTLLPLLALSTVRWASVGQFGLSAFTGYHIGSIGALFLDGELVAELPEEQRPLAQEILEERRRRGLQPMRLWNSTDRYHAREFGLTMFEIVEPIVTRRVLDDLGLELREDLSTELGPMDIPGMVGPTTLEIDRRLGALGKAAVRARPLVYAKWVVHALRLGVAKIHYDRWVLLLTSLLALSLPFALLRAALDPGALARPWSDRVLAVVGLAAVGGLYFAGHTMIIALIHWPKDRYATAANLLLPTVLAVGLFELWRWILRPPVGVAVPRRLRGGLAGRVARPVLALAIALLAADAVGRLAGIDFARQERRLAEVPIFYRQPRVPTGPAFFRRAGPDAWQGPVLPGGESVTIRYDEHGFRNRPALSDWEIVVVGDGFVESGYLPRRRLFTSELGRRLGVRVKNLGVSHTGNLTHIHYLETWGKAPATRQAVLVFNEGDDLRDLPREAYDLTTFQASGRRPYRRLVPQSSLLRALFGAVVPGSHPSDDLGLPTLADFESNAALRLPGAAEELRVRIAQRAPVKQHLTPARLEQLQEVARRWAKAARGLGLEPWLLYMPSKQRILRPYLRFDEGADPALARNRPAALPRLLRRIAQAEGIGFIDPIPRLESATRRGLLVYNPLDVHLSAEGSRQVGRVLAAHLQSAEQGQARQP